MLKYQMLICSKCVSLHTNSPGTFPGFERKSVRGPCRLFHPWYLSSININQSESSQLISSDYLWSIESCQGDESCTSQEENMLPAPRILWNSSICIPARQNLLCRNCLLYSLFSSIIYLCFIVSSLIFVNISVTSELQLIHLLCNNLQINSINGVSLN